MATLGSMRAAVVGAARRVTLAQVEVPQPGPEQVLIALEGCGVCGSNLPVWEGRPWFVYPREPGNPGHEGWGRIVARGAEVDDWAIGDRVAFLSDHAFAEYDVADASVLVALPPGLDGLDVPGEALGCAMNVFRRCEITPGQTVAVVGVGFIGALVLALAGKAGATVVGLSTRETALAFARELGATAAVSLAQPDDQVVEAVTRIVGEQGCDCVIEATGLQRPLDIAARLCGTRRRLVIAGFHQDGPRKVDMQLWNWRGLDVINAHERECSAYVFGMRAAIDAMATGQLDLRPFITHRVPLADSQAAFELLHTRPPGFVKAVIVP